ncbi:hypothetical protein PI23P_02902 [Polaribacter irgensii 23-P]|uniref:Uncharacterized protein n=1 Tax=Polaribacter irgensii 23-P TaxID=313594 RepID=A4BWR7_9FLAO|nr:hypothetical protein PI23P_02902 [Polaribacter irgensii 23-P]
MPLDAHLFFREIPNKEILELLIVQKNKVKKQVSNYPK